MSKMWLALGTAVLAGGVALALSGCGPGKKAGNGGNGGTANGTAEEGEKPYTLEGDPLVNPDTLVQPHDAANCGEDEYIYTVLDGNPDNLNALFQTSTYEFMVNGAIYDGPFTFNAKMEWAINPTFTEKLDISEDQKTWTLTLKKGLKWHDGHPFTAHDIVYSWKEILDERVPCPSAKTGTDEVVECVALDDHTVKYVHKSALPTSKWNVMFPIIPKHLYEKGKAEDPTLKKSAYYSELNRKPVGCGPYKFVEWVDDTKIVVERFEEYTGPKPHFKRMIFKIIPDNTVRMLSFNKGDIDEMALTAEQCAVGTVKSDEFKQIGYKAVGDRWSFGYIGWNHHDNPFFGDRKVRHAMTHALNIPKLIEKLVYNLASPAHGIYHPDSWMFNPEVKILPFDLKKSAQLLDEAGWKQSDDDGWRYKDIDGEKVKFSFTFMFTSGVPTWEKLVAVYQKDLKSIGVEMKTNPMEWATLSEKTRNCEFQAFGAGWGTGTDPDTGWNLWRTEERKKGRNYVGFSNPRVDELFELGRKEFDHAKRVKIYQEIQKIVYDEQPYTFLWNRKLTWAFNKRIRGVTFSPRGVWNFDPAEKAWWVHKSEQAYNLPD